MTTPDFVALNSTIKQAGADWIAGETPYSKYHGSDQRNTILGLAMTPESAFESLSDSRNNEIKMMLGPPAPLPSKIDWRHNNKQNFVTQVKDQGTCGSCVAFATVAVLESRALIKTSKPAAHYNLSEAHLFYCGVADACALGWEPGLAMAFAATTGVGKEADFPYKPGNQACRTVQPVIKAIRPATAATSAARKKALQDGPVVAAFAVYDDFFSYKSGVYRHVVGNLAGYHAVCVVGYDEKLGCWIAKNSWTRAWGENGFFNIRYGECGIDTQFPFDFPEDVDLLGNHIS